MDSDQYTLTLDKNGDITATAADGATLRKQAGLHPSEIKLLRRLLKELEAGASTGEDFRDLGELLYDVLIGDKLGAHFATACEHAKSKNLCIRLDLHPDHRLGGEFRSSALPWEFLYSEKFAFLATNPALTLTRFVPLDLPTERERGPLPLRVLFVGSQPQELGKVFSEPAAETIKTKLAGDTITSDRVVVRVIEHPARDTLIQAINEFRPHVFHYMGHGRFVEENGGALALVDPKTGVSIWLSETEVDALFQEWQPYAMVLVACEGAKESFTSGRVLSFVRAVAKKNIQVIGIQFELSNQTAMVFTREFYGQLAQGQMLDAATQSTRAKLYQSDPRATTRDFGGVVLYLRTANAIILPSMVTSPESSGLADKFAATIQGHMATLDREVKRLTADQQRVIHQLRGVNRVRISGCAGSGKTLIAAEKAIRLCDAGLRTLFLCHNPLLADHVRLLTKGSGTQVETFGQWVARLAGNSTNPDEDWTNFEEPDATSLGRAFDVLAGCKSYDAVIVDEGQDFREEWWTIVEAALVEPFSGMMYIFHDERQAVLPFRSSYPIREPVLDLSRNCRNSGRIYELVRCLQPEAPSAEEHLSDLGETFLLTYPPGEGQSAIEKAINWVDRRGQIESVVAILGGIHLLEHSALAHPVPTRPGGDWQAEVSSKFHHVIRTADSLRLPAGGWDAVQADLSRLSSGPYPTAHDIELVRKMAATFQLPSKLRRAIENDPNARAPMSWVIRDRQLRLWKHGRHGIWAAEIITHFEQGNWHKGIPEPDMVRFVRHFDGRGSGTVPVYRVGDFKGLEADTVLFHIEGSVPISREELYVGISRARMFLALVVDQQAVGMLPRAILRHLSLA